MKKLLLLLTGGVVIALAGCYSASSLDRKPAPRKPRPAVKRVARPARGEEKVDPAFDLVFKSKPQKHGNSHLSDGEASYLRKQRNEDEAVLRSIRGRERLKENTRQKDMVFGTEGGRYF